MDKRIINDAFEEEPHMCSFCECPLGNHLIFHRCALFEMNPICQEDCRISMLKDNVEAQVSEKLGHPITKQDINSICYSCGLNNACQNNDLADRLEKGLLGDDNEQKGPTKTR